MLKSSLSLRIQQLTAYITHHARRILLLLVVLLGIYAGTLILTLIQWRFTLSSGMTQDTILRLLASIGVIGVLLGLYFRSPFITRVAYDVGRKAGSLFLGLFRHGREWWTRFSAASFPARVRMVRIPGVLLMLLLLWYMLQSVLTPPKIIVTFPGNDGIEVPLTSTIEVQFDKKMHQGSVQSAFSLTPEVVGAFSWEGESTLIFTPAEQLARNQEYAVDVGRFALSSYFIPKISSDHIVFTTLGHPHVVLASPQTEAPSGDAPITVIFDRPMVTLTTASEKEQFQAAFTISPTLSGEGRWLGTTAYQFRPDEVPQAATTYTYKVPVGLPSEDGGSIQEDTVFSFSTERPHIQSTSPLREYGYANPVASISATLNLPIDPESAKNAFHLIHFKDGKEEEVPMTVKFVGTQQIGMYPAKPLIRSDRYGARIDAGLTSTSGPNGLETPYTWEF
ncbi:Ig-like domain-containing protein, partial [Candidatus Roizmanbacteria bacterium]|nr:Ig-like domain-containing protein [Candidatus Roizmanbacteria bacterium]